MKRTRILTNFDIDSYKTLFDWMKIQYVNSNHFGAKINQTNSERHQGGAVHIKSLLKPQSNNYIPIIYVSVESKIYLCKLKYIVFRLHCRQMAIMRCNLVVRRYQIIGKSHTGTIGHIFLFFQECRPSV